eukprot:1318224-Amorphochlora_amoeboformis.AAC.4
MPVRGLRLVTGSRFQSVRFSMVLKCTCARDSASDEESKGNKKGRELEEKRANGKPRKRVERKE